MDFSTYMKKHSTQRVGVLVDVQNMYHSAKHLFDSRVDFGKLLELVVGDRPLIRSLAYVICSQDETDEEIKFFDALVSQGYEVVIKKLLVFQGGHKKGDWDVGLCVDAIKVAEKVDTVILVTGDGDFVPLVHYLKDNKGCRVEAASFKSSTSSDLVEAVDQFIDLSKHSNQVLLGSKNDRADSRAQDRNSSISRYSRVKKEAKKIDRKRKK